MELRHPAPGRGKAEFLLGADVRHEEARDFKPDLNFVFGIELPTVRRNSAINLLASYDNGRSPNGQFWRDHVQIIGLKTSFTF